MTDIIEALKKTLEQLKSVQEDHTHVVLARTKVTEAIMWLNQYKEDQAALIKKSQVGFRSSDAT